MQGQVLSVLKALDSDFFAQKYIGLEQKVSDLLYSIPLFL